jgi:cytochrome c biogenesis protein CcmG/thiol:disulfide interchange protein DsbE
MTLLPEVESAILDAVRRDQAARSRRLGRRIPRRLLVVALAFVVLSASAVAASYFSNVENAITHGEHPVAPSVDLPSIVGRRDISLASISLASYRGQVVVLSFWASWCQPCREQAPELTAVNRWLHRRHIGTVLIDDVYENPRHAGRELPRLLPGVPAVRDPDTPGSTRPFGVEGLPTTFVIDPHGRVTGFHPGEQGASLTALLPLIRRAAPDS